MGKQRREAIISDFSGDVPGQSIRSLFIFNKERMGSYTLLLSFFAALKTDNFVL